MPRKIDHPDRSAVDHMIVRQQRVHEIAGVIKSVLIKQRNRIGAELPKRRAIGARSAARDPDESLDAPEQRLFFLVFRFERSRRLVEISMMLDVVAAPQD